MNTSTISHDTQVFSQMTDILVMSGTGIIDYGICISDYGTLAFVMNQKGLMNKWRKPLNANSLKKVTERIRKKGLLDEHVPDWSEFNTPQGISKKRERLVQLKQDYLTIH